LHTAPELLDYIIEANGVLLSLDALALSHDPTAVALAVSDAVLVYAELLVLQDTRQLGPPESMRLQIALDRLRARLNFFGQSV
jgi:hypothetical protein